MLLFCASPFALRHTDRFVGAPKADVLNYK
jgi:hypothetical protein